MNRPLHHSLSPDGAVHCVRRGESLPEYEEPSSFTYAAFISYRHLPRDTEVAQQVQKAIETYRLPRGVVAKQPGDEGNSAARSIRSKTSSSLGKCFRDEDELAASPSLPDSIQEALAQSRSLIVVCSPETQESAWIQREIETFIALHGRERIICVLAAGSSEESIPPILKTRMMPDAAGIMREMPAEPLAADLRPESKNKRKAELLRIIAAVANCNYDDLRRRHRNRKRRLITAAAFAILALIALISVLVHQTARSSEEALIAESKYLAARSQEQLARGERLQAIQSALDALPSSEADRSRPLVPEAQEALENALLVYPDPDQTWRPLYAIDSDSDIVSFAHDVDGDWFATLNDSGLIEFRSLSKGALTATAHLGDYAEHPEELTPSEWSLEATGDRHLLLMSQQANGSMVCFDALTGTLVWEHEQVCADSFASAQDEDTFGLTTFMGDGNLDVAVIDAATSNVRECQSLDLGFDSVPEVSLPSWFASKSNQIFLGIPGGVLGFDLNAETCTAYKLNPLKSITYSVREFGGILFCASASLPEEGSGGTVPLWIHRLEYP